VSVESIYPSQQQPKADNPLFARRLRRRRRAFIAILMMIGLGLMIAQIIPMNARADNPLPETPAIALSASASVEANGQAMQAVPQKPARKAARQIPLYNAPLQNQAAAQ